jgi:hypothetical protein
MLEHRLPHTFSSFFRHDVQRDLMLRNITDSKSVHRQHRENFDTQVSPVPRDQRLLVRGTGNDESSVAEATKTARLLLAFVCCGGKRRRGHSDSPCCRGHRHKAVLPCCCTRQEHPNRRARFKLCTQTSFGATISVGREKRTRVADSSFGFQRSIDRPGYPCSCLWKYGSHWKFRPAAETSDKNCFFQQRHARPNLLDQIRCTKLVSPVRCGLLLTEVLATEQERLRTAITSSLCVETQRQVR